MEVEAVAGAPETPEQAVARRDQAIHTWLNDRSLLSTIKPQEMASRQKVTDILFPAAHKGTQRFALNGGYAIKLLHGYTYTLGDKDKIAGEGEQAVKVPIADQVNEIIAKIVAIGGGDIADELISWTPKLNEKSYLALKAGDPIKEIIDSILTIKPASPQLTFEEPKAQ
jgi:hypothetical protein